MADEVERAAWSFSEWCEKRRGFSVGTGYNLVRQGKLKITKIGALSFVTAAEDVLPKDEFASTTRKYLLAMVDEINGCYQFGFYDGCAVMCRRLMETLLIEVFEHLKAGDKIKADGEYIGLGDIISRARGGQHFKLQRGSADVMEAIKLLGDTAAHSRMYITKQPDIDDQRFKYRKVISELLHLAGMAC